MQLGHRMFFSVLALGLGAACTPAGEAPPEPVDTAEKDDEAIAPLPQGAFVAVANQPHAVTTLTAGDQGPANRLAMMLDLLDADDDAALPVSVVGIDEDGVATDSVEAEVTFAEGALRTLVVDFDRPVSEARLSIDAEDLLRVRSLTPAFSTIVADREGLDATAAAEAEGALSSALSDIGVLPRSAWTTLNSTCTSNDPNKWRMAIHHTVTHTGQNFDDYAAKMRQMRSWHQGRGWCDLGYHFVIAIDGTIFEARPIKHGGAHVAYSNSGNVGISFMGCFHPTQCGAAAGPHTPTEAMINSAGRLVKALSDIYGIQRTSTYVKGHRDHPNVSKACPGDYVANLLGEIRGYNGDGTVTLPGFCAGKTGHWCVGNDLVQCQSGDEVERTACAHGCQGMPAGTPDQCAPPPDPPTFCNANGDKSGSWCDGSDLVVCDDGDLVSRTTCGLGCQGMPAGTPDQCVTTTFCNADGDKTGSWCDGDDLVVCSGGDLVSRTGCDDGCQSMPSGTPDQCYTDTFCWADGDKTGSWCDGDDLVVCSGGDLVSRTTCSVGCQGMPAGTPDQCAADDFCSANGNKTGTWCDGDDLVVCSSGALSSRTTCTAGCQSMPSGTPDQCN